MRCVLFVVVMAFASNVFAQEKCERVIELSKVVEEVVSDHESVEQHARSFCSDYRQYKTSGRSMNIGASYKFLAATFARSNVSAEDIANKYCSESSDYSARKDAYKRYVETIAPGAYEAYAKCIEFRNGGVVLDLQSMGRTQLVLVAAFTPRIANDTNAELTYQQRLPSGVTCNWDVSKNRVEILSRNQTSALTCDRTDQTTSQDITVFRRNASGPDSVITLHWRSIPPDDVVKALTKRLSALESRLSTISQSGKIEMRAVNTPGLQEVGHGGVQRGELDGKVDFKPAFPTIPAVSAGLSELVINALDVRDRHRVHFEVTEITENGFKYKFWTAGDVKVSVAVIRWIAVVK